MKMRVKEIILSYSVLNEWRKCPKSFRFKYLRNLRKVQFDSTADKGSPLEFGQVIHKGIETYLLGRLNGTPVERYSITEPDEPTKIVTTGGDTGHDSAARHAIDVAMTLGASTSLSNVEVNAKRSLDHARQLLEQYFAHYADDDTVEPFKLGDVPAVELELDVELLPATDSTPRIVWRAHLDALVKLTKADNVLAVKEVKTSSGNLASDLIDRMLPNNQAVGYAFAVQTHLGLPVPPNVLFDGLSSNEYVLRRHLDPSAAAAYEKKTGKQNEPLFLRHLVQIEPWMIDEWKQATVRDALRLVQDIEENRFSDNAPDSCTVFSKRCQYAEICKASPQYREPLAENMFDVVEPWKGFSMKLEETPSE